MSSHHIVREKQEPALLIMSLDSFDPEYLGQLLEWSPTVIVNEPEYGKTEQLGIKIDIVISPNPDFAAQHHTRLILTETNPLEDALKFLIGEQYHAVNIIAGSFCIKDYAFFTESLNLVVFTNGKKIFPVKSGFSKWQTGGQTVELLHEARHLHTSGLKYLNNAVYETEKDGFFSLSFEQPFIFVAEKL